MQKLDKLFNTLDDWRSLPSYQLERRSDIFFAIHLEEIFEKTLGINIDIIIPEFPVRKGDISTEEKQINQSYKIDYLVYSSAINEAFLVELKTDKNSRRENQDSYLKKAASLKTHELISGIEKIYKATKQKEKYKNLLQKLKNIGWIENTDLPLDIKKTDINTSVIYIQPEKTKNDETVISFDDIISALSEINDPLTIRFLKSLRQWKTDIK